MTATIDGEPLIRPQLAGGRLLTVAAFVLPPLAVLAVAGGLALRGGGVAPGQWQAAAVGLIACLLVLAAVGAVPRIPRSAWPMLACFVALLAWSAASLQWSESREATAESVVRLLLLAAAAVVGAAYASRAREALALAAGLALFATLAASSIELKLLTGSTSAFAGSRLSWPIDYANANAALVWLPLSSLLAFAAARGLHPALRGLCGLFAALALAVGLAAESRGATVALAGALIAAVAIARDRGRFALTLLVVILPVALVAGRMMAGDPSSSPSDVRARGLAALAAAVVAAGLVYALAIVEQRGGLSFEARERRAAVAAWAMLLAVGVAAFTVRAGNPGAWLQERWNEFRNVDATLAADGSHFDTGFSNRYDYWRVAWKTFEAKPVQGVGSGAFSVPWFQSRSIDENVTDAHSWEAAALAETGIVGLALIAAVLVLPLAGIRAARRGGRAWQIAAVAFGGTVVYFVLHASTDWLFRIPAIAIPGFVAVGALASAGSSGPVALAGRGERAILALAALLAAAAVVPAFLSTRATNHAQARAAASSSAALDELESAARLNPFSAEPLILQAAILGSSGGSEDAVRAAEDATRRTPNGWTAWLALADARRSAGRETGARVALARAAELNPRAPQLQAFRP